jgi:transposase
VSRKTIYKYNWLNSWERQGLVGLYNRPGRRRKATFSLESQQQIRDWAEQSPGQFKQVIEEVAAQWHISVSRQTIKRVLKAVQSGRFELALAIASI